MQCGESRIDPGSPGLCTPQTTPVRHSEIWLWRARQFRSVRVADLRCNPQQPVFRHNARPRHFENKKTLTLLRHHADSANERSWAANWTRQTLHGASWQKPGNGSSRRSGSETHTGNQCPRCNNPEDLWRPLIVVWQRASKWGLAIKRMRGKFHGRSNRQQPQVRR